MADVWIEVCFIFKKDKKEVFVPLFFKFKNFKNFVKKRLYKSKFCDNIKLHSIGGLAKATQTRGDN